MDVKRIRTNSALADRGAWEEGLPGLGDLRLKVRALSNADAVALRAKLVEAVPRTERPGGHLSPDAARKIDAAVLSRCVLLDWENLTDDGGPITFSADTAEQYLADPDYRALAEGVVIAAVRLQDRASEDEQATAKNS